MNFTVLEPREIKRGLYVEFIEEPKDCFCMTSFDIRFTVPGEQKISEGYFKVIKDTFNNGLAKTEHKSHVMHFGDIDGTGISINISGHIKKDVALALVTKICSDFLAIKTVIVDPKAFKNPHEGIAYFNGAQSVIREYLKDITENNMYEYEETRI